MMRPHLIFLTLALAFLTGVATASIGLTLLGAVLPALAVFVALASTKVDARISLLTSLIFLLGNAYYWRDDQLYRAAVTVAPAQATMQGTIASDPKIAPLTQSFTLRTASGNFSVFTSDYPQFAYGDQLGITGKVLPPTSTYEQGQHLLGTLHNPTITNTGANVGNPIQTKLFALRHALHGALMRVLLPEHSALLFNIAFGGVTGFSKDFVNKLSLSGLRFITAIDGLHLQIVINLIVIIATFFLARSRAFALSLPFAILYLGLTGFTISGIRAVIMGYIGGFAHETGRAYARENVLALAGVLLTLINPKAPAFDLGFQLSFLAVLAILYLKPALEWLLPMRSEPNKNFIRSVIDLALISLSIQLLTAPLVMATFGTFSLTAFVASVFVVWLLPFIIGAGLILGFLQLMLPIFALALSFFVAPLLDYVIFVVNTFARTALPFNPSLNIVFVLVYYGLLASFLFWFHGTSS